MIPTIHLNSFYPNSSLRARLPYSIPHLKGTPSPPSSSHFRYIHPFSQSLTSHSLNVSKPLKHLSVNPFPHCFGTPTFSLTTSFLHLSHLVTPHMFRRQFISATSSLFLSSTRIPHDSDTLHYFRHHNSLKSYLFTPNVTLRPLHTFFIEPNALVPSSARILIFPSTPPSLLK